MDWQCSCDFCTGSAYDWEAEMEYETMQIEIEQDADRYGYDNDHFQHGYEEEYLGE